MLSNKQKKVDCKVYFGHFCIPVYYITDYNICWCKNSKFLMEENKVFGVKKLTKFKVIFGYLAGWLAATRVSQK